MNSFLTLLALAFAIFVCVESQPLADARLNFIPYLAEQINPVFRRHRARLRPFAGQLGSPVINIRGARSIEQQSEKVNEDQLAQCIFGFESLFCAGIDTNGKQQSVECDAQENFLNTGLENVNNFVLSDLRILKTSENTSIVKMYMFGQKETNSSVWMNHVYHDKATNNRNIVSVHTTDNHRDQGLNILDSKCWEKMVEFFKSMKVVNEVTVENVDLADKVYKSPIKVIAKVTIL